MIFTRIAADRFRNLSQIDFRPAPGINLITGQNGAGKSSVLEAMQCLSVGHSFRSRKPRELIAHGAGDFILTCEMLDSVTGQVHRSGLSRGIDGSVELKYNFESLKSFQFVTQQLPIKSLTPESHGLIQEGPAARRQFVDWGVFHGEPGFMPVWREFRRALSQRNMAIRMQRPDAEVQTWDDVLISSSDQIDIWRQEYVALLSQEVASVCKRLGVGFPVSVTHRAGWSDEKTFTEALRDSFENNRRMKTTTVGPHRSELVIRCNDHLSRIVLSRGQQKILVYVLELAQVQLLAKCTGRRAVVLCDDLQSELDESHLQRVVGELRSLELQIFVTGSRKGVFSEPADAEFHVEQGRLQASTD